MKTVPFETAFNAPLSSLCAEREDKSGFSAPSEFGVANGRAAPAD
jgi:hypothetical protein